MVFTGFSLFARCQVFPLVFKKSGKKWSFSSKTEKNVKMAIFVKNVTDKPDVCEMSKNVKNSWNFWHFWHFPWGLVSTFDPSCQPVLSVGPVRSKPEKTLKTPYQSLWKSQKVSVFDVFRGRKVTSRGVRFVGDILRKLVKNTKFHVFYWNFMFFYWIQWENLTLPKRWKTLKNRQNPENHEKHGKSRKTSKTAILIKLMGIR